MTRISLWLLALGVLTACTSGPAQQALPEHAIKVGGNAAPSDLDSCINDAIGSMAGKWVMQFSASSRKGTVGQTEGTLIIGPKSEGRWTIRRPNKAGEFVPFSTITNYGEGLLDSISVDDSFGTIYEETFVECHAPDASGRFRYVSYMQPTRGPFSNSMTITRTGWGTPNHHYSIDVIEWDDGSYALSTRAGERVED